MPLNIPIRTERLILRDFVSGDWPDVLAYQRDSSYYQYYTWTSRTEDDVRKFVRNYVDQQLVRPRRKIQLAIALPDDPRVIGNCGIRRKPDNQWEGDIGYELAQDHWNRGYATEAAQAMVRFGFQELGLHRISAWCIADNAASARVLEKVGMRQEGRLRENRYFKERWWDTLLYALLKDEWRLGSNES